MTTPTINTNNKHQKTKTANNQQQHQQQLYKSQQYSFCTFAQMIESFWLTNTCDKAHPLPIPSQQLVHRAHVTPTVRILKIRGILIFALGVLN